MRVYGKIESAFWQNQKTRKLSERAKMLLIYIYTCPHGNSLGCFVLPKGYISADLDWATEQVSEHVSELVSKGFIQNDHDANLVRVVGWFDHNTIENDNVAKAAIRTVAALPKSPIKSSLIKDMKKLNNKFLNKFPNELLDEFRNPEPSQSLTEPDNSCTPPRTMTPFEVVYTSGCGSFPALATANTSAIHAWLNAGCDVQLDILPEMLRQTGKSINSWKYFTSAIMDAKATRETPPQKGNPRENTRRQFNPRTTKDDRARAAVMRAAESGGFAPEGRPEG